VFPENPETLSQLLDCLSWSGEHLAREICRVLGTGAVHLIPAIAGMEVPWTLAGTLAIARDWLLGGLMDRRVFMAVSGSALTELVWTAVNTEPARLAAALNGGQVDATLIEQVEESIPRLRQLDDRQGGGGANLIYVNAVIVRALVSSRLAYGYALAGDAERVHAAHSRARELVEHPTGHPAHPQSERRHRCAVPTRRVTERYLADESPRRPRRAGAGVRGGADRSGVGCRISTRRAVWRSCAVSRASFVPGRPTVMSASSPSSWTAG
jgi:hypothetical protein